MIAAIRRRIDTTIDRLMRRRTPTHAAPMTLSRRRLFILPTRSGAVFALLLLVMLLGATHYSSSLGFALTFWLIAIALVSMHHAHRNLVGLTIAAISADPVFAGAPACFEITLENDARRLRRAIRVGAEPPATAGDPATDVAAGTPVTKYIRVAAERRGHLPCPRLRVESIYPMGLFRAWSWLQPSAEALVYPRPAGSLQLPVPADGQQQADTTPGRGADEFIDHRRYVAGDSPRQIDWKATARTDDVLVREHIGRVSRTLWLDYDQLATRDPEARVSQLVLWLLDADNAGLYYGLRLPGERLGPDRGRAHRARCLRALALI